MTITVLFFVGAVGLIVSGLALIRCIAIDDRREARRRQRRRVFDQAACANPLFTQGLRPIGGLPPTRSNPTHKDPECPSHQSRLTT